jgi:hypothetical protein
MATGGDDARHAAFAAWVRRHGGYISPSVRLFAPLPGGGRGVAAAADVAEGEQLLLVPHHLCLYAPARDDAAPVPSSLPDAAAAAPVPAALAALAAADPPPSPFTSAVMLLLAERARGAASAFAPYVDLLPEAYDCLLAWDDAERALLAGTPLEGAALLGERAEGAFARDAATLLAAHPAVWPAAACGPAAFAWAAAAVQTRSFHLESLNWVTGARAEGAAQFLIPGVDCLNHSTDPARRSTALALVDEPLTVVIQEEEVQQDAEPSTATQREVSFRGYFTMKASRALRKGEEILHTYGDLSSARLLQTFGFAEAAVALPGGANPHDEVALPCAAVAAACAAEWAADPAAAADPASGQAARLALLAELNLLAPAGAVVLPAVAPLTEELLTAVQVLVMPAPDFLEYAAHVASKAGGSDGVLGRAYLDDGEFREAVGLCFLRAAQAALGRLAPGGKGGAAADAAAAADEARWRAACAARVRLAQRTGIDALRREVLELMAAGGGEASGSEESGSEEEESGSEESEESEESEGEAAGGAARGKRRRS